MNLRIKQNLPLIPGALPLKSGGAPETRGTRFPYIDFVSTRVNDYPLNKEEKGGIRISRVLGLRQ